MKILNRYILREVLLTWFAVTAVLLFILLTNQFARVLGKAATGELPREAVLILLGLTSIQFLTVLIPVALLLAIMLGLGRMYRDSEMVAILACGIGSIRLYRPLILLAAVLAMTIGWLATTVTPWSLRLAEITRYAAQETMEFGSLEPGRFHSDSDGKTVFFAEAVEEDGTLSNVFIQRRNKDNVEVSVSRKGALTEADENGWRTMLLFDGKRYEGVPGSPVFNLMEFAEEGVPLRPAMTKVKLDKTEMLPFDALIGSDDPVLMAELQWRLSGPVMIFVLTLLAVPMARTNPRQGRYAKILFAILVYMLYSNMLGISRSWLEDGRIHPLLGMLWVHVLMAGVGVFMLANQSRLFQRLFKRPARKVAT